ncbi:MAG: HNH endonuclease [Salinivirgaceae bacterium]|nr:HNH endonuclease [Salinivirgaceae bacterium]
MKPWRDCSNPERLDSLNGLLLHPTLDHLFDAGLITFEDNGHIRFSDQLSQEDLELLHIAKNICLRKLPDGISHYLSFHRKNVFKHSYCVKNRIKG